MEVKREEVGSGLVIFTVSEKVLKEGVKGARRATCTLEKKFKLWEEYCVSIKSVVIW